MIQLPDSRLDDLRGYRSYMKNKIIKAKLLRTVISPLFICSAFILCAALGMLIYPEAFNKFFSPSQLVREPPPQLPHRSYYWDVEHYANMALNDICSAFYPLWPLIIRILFHPQTVDQAAYSFLITATIISFISIFILVYVFGKALKRKYLAFLLVLAYSLNPMSIFRFIGYTESLFSVLSIIFIWAFVCKKAETTKLGVLCLVTFLMCLTRPVLIQLLFSSIASLTTIFCFEGLKQQSWFGSNFLTHLNKYTQEIKITIGLWVSAVLGYSVYGIFCLKSRGNFFAPFQDQQYWGKSLGLHLELLLLPKSLLFDLLGLYLPLMVLVISLTFVYFKLRKKEPSVFIPKSAGWNILVLYPPLLIVLYIFNYLRLKKKKVNSEDLKPLKTSDYTATLSENYLFWFCVYFPAAHSAIVFLTQDRLFSLARFVFAVPFFFMALGYLCRCIPGKKTYKAILWFILISAIALVQQWVSYGKDEWLG